jgi:hypothetical protein
MSVSPNQPRVCPVIYVWYSCAKYPAGHVALEIVNESESLFGHITVPGRVINFFAEDDSGGTRFSNPFSNQKSVSLGFVDKADFNLRHRKYRLNGRELDMTVMRIEIDLFNQSPQAYNLLTFNCATAVAHIMKKGRVIGAPSKCIWLPTDIARWCDHLVMLNNAVKVKSIHL